jgi:hypothetical protein
MANEPIIPDADAIAQTLPVGQRLNATANYEPTFSKGLRESLAEDADLEAIRANIIANSPVLARHDYDFEQVDELHPNYNPERPHGAAIEFLQAGYDGNTGDKPLLRAFKNFNTDPREQQEAIFGDLLHNLSDNDPIWQRLRKEYMDARDQKQIEFDKRKFQELKDAKLENRKFEEWMDLSWADASIREPLKGNKEWLGFQTPRQLALLDKMQNYLATGEDPFKKQ